MESLEAFKVVAKRSRVKLKELLFAGLKDKNAVTTQFVAVKRPLTLKEISMKNLKLEFVGRLGAPPRKLIYGNRFTVTVRGAPPPDERRVKLLRELGIPNYYGEQRFTSVREGRPAALLVETRMTLLGSSSLLQAGKAQRQGGERSSSWREGTGRLQGFSPGGGRSCASSLRKGALSGRGLSLFLLGSLSSSLTSFSLTCLTSTWAG